MSQDLISASSGQSEGLDKRGSVVHQLPGGFEQHEIFNLEAGAHDQPWCHCFIRNMSRVIESVCVEVGLAGTGTLAPYPVWWVVRVVVHRNLRRRGFGTVALTAAVNRIRQVSEAPIWVAPSGYDTPLEDQIAFYEANGFKPHEYGDGVWVC